MMIAVHEPAPTEITRSWFARCCYPGYQPFIIGTGFTDRNAGEEAARLAMIDLIDRVLPTRPTIISIEPGAVFVEADLAGAVYA
jgi:hypothetical protein